MSFMSITFVNGELSSYCSVFDRGIQFGDGVFETMLFCNGELEYFELHWNRLKNGCERIGFECPNIKNKLLTLVSKHAQQHSVVKLIVTRGSSTRGYTVPKKISANWILTIATVSFFSEYYYKIGVKVKLCDARLPKDPQLAGIKHLNRLVQVLAKQELSDEYQEGLLKDCDDYIIEGCMSNLFLIKDNSLLTPDLSYSGVKGVMRQNIIDFCLKKHIPCKIKPIKYDDILVADEIFLTNSVLKVWPVRAIESVCYSVGQLTKSLVNHFVFTKN